MLMEFMEVGWLCWGLTSQSTIFQSCGDGAIASWVINQYFQGNLWRCKTFSPANQITGNKHNDEELELHNRMSHNMTKHAHFSSLIFVFVIHSKDRIILSMLKICLIFQDSISSFSGQVGWFQYYLDAHLWRQVFSWHGFATHQNQQNDLCAQRRLGLADLSLRWVHMPLCWFCREVAHLIISNFEIKVKKIHDICQYMYK